MGPERSKSLENKTQLITWMFPISWGGLSTKATKQDKAQTPGQPSPLENDATRTSSLTMCGHIKEARTREDATVARTPLIPNTPSQGLQHMYKTRKRTGPTERIRRLSMILSTVAQNMYAQ